MPAPGGASRARDPRAGARAGRSGRAGRPGPGPRAAVRAGQSSRVWTVPPARPGRREEFSRRPGAGRAAGTPAAPARSTAGAAVRAGTPAALRDAVRRASGRPRRRRPRPSTARLAAVAVVLGLLVISYASSVRTYLSQRAEIAGVRAAIAQHGAQIATSQARIEQWSDPAYIEITARERYGLVLPGQHLYLVVDDPGATVARVRAPSVGGARVTVPGAGTWWARVAGSVGAAGSATTPPTTGGAVSTTPPAAPSATPSAATGPAGAAPGAAPRATVPAAPAPAPAPTVRAGTARVPGRPGFPIR